MQALRQPAQVLPDAPELPVELEKRAVEPLFVRLALGLPAGQQVTAGQESRVGRGRKLVPVPVAAGEIRALPRLAPPALA